MNQLAPARTDRRKNVAKHQQPGTRVALSALKKHLRARETRIEALRRTEEYRVAQALIEEGYRFREGTDPAKLHLTNRQNDILFTGSRSGDEQTLAALAEFIKDTCPSLAVQPDRLGVLYDALTYLSFLDYSAQSRI